MSVRRLHPVQPESFEFSPENLEWAKVRISRYPEGRQFSAVIPLLWRAQEQCGGWLPEPALRYVADMLEMPYIRVYEVATFYTMFNLSPVGRSHVQLCGTTPCMLRGSEDLKAVCRRVIGEPGEVTDDGALSWVEAECIGACVNAPVALINNDYYEDLTPESFETILTELRAGRVPKPGPQVDRINSAPVGGPRTLTDPALFNGRPAAEPVQAAEKAPDQPPPPGGSTGTTPIGKPPRGLKRPRGGVADDLKKINRIGTRIEQRLNELGIFHYDQIASWSPGHAEWIDQELDLKGRVAREDWIAQARRLAGKGE